MLFFLLSCIVYPPFPLGLRGTNADVVVLEEAAHMDEEVFDKVVAALISMNHVPLLAISVRSIILMNE